MAKVTKIPAAPAPPPTYVLELSEDEARMLYDLVGCGVIGSTTSSRRVHTDSVYVALNEVFSTVDWRRPKDMDGHVTFLDKQVVSSRT